MKSISIYLRFVLALLFILQAVPGDIARAQTPTEAQPLNHLYLPLLMTGGQAPAVVTAQTVSTPVLIQQAYEAGLISNEQRILYLAYALFEPASLPAEYQSTVGWYGTQYVTEVNAFSLGLSAASTDAISQELSRLSTLAATICDIEDGANSFESANFHFNYGTLEPALTLADYVTSMETTFDIEVTQFGWAKPPLCTGGDTCDGEVNPYGKYPIQIADIGGSFYGYVAGGFGGLYSGFIGDNPNTSATETASLSSCMVLNADFEQFPEPTAKDALDATTSHEYVHAIQAGYGDPSPSSDRMWVESAAAYMEDEIFDSANSDYQYLWPVVDNSLGEWPNNNDPGGVSQYSNFLFFRHVAEQHGGTNVAGGGERVMQRFLENRAAGQDDLIAYNNALVAESSNLPDAFHTYAIAAKFMKGCTGGYAGAYCFAEGPDYAAFVGSLPPVHGSVANPGSFNGTIKNHYAANWVTLPTGAGPVNVTLSNTASGGQLRGSLVCDTGATLTVTPFTAVVGAGTATTLPAYSTVGCTSAVAVITNQEQLSGNPNTVTAQSYTLSIGPAAATATPTNTPVPPTATSTNTPVPPTNTPVSTATNTSVPPTVTNTVVPPTATKTNTPIAPTATNTGVPPTATKTNTPVAPTATKTNTPVVPTPTKTNTPIVPTATKTPVPPTATKTNTPVPPTKTATPTKTPVPPTPTKTVTPTKTATPVNVTGQLELKSLTGVSATNNPDATYPAQSTKGVVMLNMNLKNTGVALRNLSYRVVVLTQNNYLLNANGGPGQVGSQLSVPNTALPGGNQLFDNGETYSQNFKLGLMSRNAFALAVSVYANKVNVNAAEVSGTAEAGELIGTFTVDLDPETTANPANSIFLPLVTK